MATNDSTQMESKLSHRWLVMVAVGVGSLLGAIDNTVVNIALPTVRRALLTDVATAEWVVVIYLLMVSGFLLAFGRIGDLRGHKPVYVWGFVTFIASSALCGLAPNVAMLILFRGVQGLGASMVYVNSVPILTATFPPSQRGRVFGLQILMVYVGYMTGPMLGGWITDTFTWRAIFYINVPIGLAALVLSAKYIPRVRPTAKPEPFDFPGAVLFLAAFSVLLIAMNQGHTYGWFSPYILSMFGAAVAMLAVFVPIESRTRSPLLDLSLFRVPAFSLSAVSAVCMYLAMFSIVFLMPFYLIQGHGFSSGAAGLLLTIQPALTVVISPLAGAVSDRIGTRWPATLGMALTAVAMVLISRLGPTSSVLNIEIAIGMAGIGIGFFVAPNNSTIMGAAPKNRLGIAGGVVATSRAIGMVLGVAISGAIFTTFTRSHTQAAFFGGIHMSFLVASATSCVGCITSAIRK